MTGALSPTHWAILAVVLVLLFGAKRLPDAARGLGQSMRIFRAEMAAPPAQEPPHQDTTGPTGPAPRQGPAPDRDRAGEGTAPPDA